MSIPNIKRLKNILFNEKTCIDFLFDNNIIQRQTICELCNSDFYTVKIYTLKIYTCSRQECRKSISIYKNSFFASKHLKSCDILLLGYLWICRTKFTQIEYITGFSPNTIVKFVKIFRELAINTLVDEDEIIGGNRIIVEIDENWFDHFWVVGFVEKTARKKYFFVVVDNYKTEILTRIIRQYIRIGLTIYTDS